MVARGKKRGGGTQRPAASASGEQTESSAAADQHEDQDDSALGDQDIEGSSELAGDQEQDDAGEVVSALDTATGEDGDIEGEAGEFMDESFEGEGDDIMALEEDEDEALEGESSHLQDILGNDMEVLDQTGDSDPENVDEENGDGANIAWVEELWNLKQAEDAKDGKDQDLDKSDRKKGKKDKDPRAEAGESVGPKKTDTGCDENERMDVTEADMEEERPTLSRNEGQRRLCCISRNFLGKFFDEKEFEYNITIHPVVQNDYPRGELRTIICMASSVRFLLEPTKSSFHKMMKLNVRGNRIAEMMESILFCTFTSNNMHFKVERRKVKEPKKQVKGGANKPESDTVVASEPDDSGQVINTVSFQQKNAFARRTLMIVDAPLGGTIKKRSLFLHNLPSSIDEKFLQILFPRCLKAGLVKVSNGVRSAVLQMSNPQIAHNHLISFTNYFIDGREIQMGVQDMSQEDALTNYYKGQQALAAKRDPKLVRKDADRSRPEKKDFKDKDGQRDGRSSSNRREESASGKKTSSVSSGAKDKTGTTKDQKTPNSKEKISATNGDGKSSSGKKDEKEPVRNKAESEEKAKALKEKKERERRNKERREKEQRDRNQREQRERSLREREQRERQGDRRRVRTDYVGGAGPRRDSDGGGRGRSPRGYHPLAGGQLGVGSREADRHYFEEMEMERRRVMGWEGVVQAEEEMRMEMQQEMELREIRLQRELELERLKQEQLAEMERRKMEREEKERLHLLMLEQERLQRLQREEAARRMQEMEDEHRRKRQQEERQERMRQERERKAEQQRLQKARERERQLEREALQKQREQERRAAAAAAAAAGWEQSAAKRSRFDSPHSSGRESHFEQGDGSYGDSFRPEGNKLHSRQKFRPGQDYRNSGVSGEGDGDMRLTLEQEVAKQADELKRNLALLEQFQQDPSRAAQHLAKVDPSLAIGKQSMRDMDMDSDPMQQPFLPPGRTIPTIAPHSVRHRPAAGQGRQQQDYGQVFEDYEQELRGGRDKDFPPQWQQQQQQQHQQRPVPQTGRVAGAQSQRGKQQRSGRGGRQGEGFVARGGANTEQSMFTREDNVAHLSYGKGAGGSFQQQSSRGKGGFSARQGAVQRDGAFDRSSQPLPSAREDVSHRAGLLGNVPDPYAKGDYQSNRGQRDQFSLQGAEEPFYGTPGARRQDPVSSHRGRGQGHGLPNAPGRDYNHGRPAKGVNRQSYY